MSLCKAFYELLNKITLIKLFLYK